MRPVLRMDTLFLFPDSSEARTNAESPAAHPTDSTITLPPSDRAPAAEADTQRLQQIEQQLTTLVRQQKQDRVQLAHLGEQLAAAQTPQQTLVLYLLLALLLMALGAIALLLRKLRAERAQAQAHWSAAVREAQASTAAKNRASRATLASQNTEKPSKNSTPQPVVESPTSQDDLWSQAESASPPPEPSTTVAPPSAQEVRQANAFVLPQASNIDSADNARTKPAPSAYSTITSQDFLDTQEQAEFFASIGEYDEAIGLLEGHIQQTGPTSPLPYLKLLEFFYQLSRTEAFEHTRQALQQHFNIAAPTLAHYSEQGQDLLHGYAQLLEPIEALWPSDEVIGLLNHLLHYPVQGNFAQPVPRLDPAAFHEVLMLHEIAQSTPASSRGRLEQRSSTAPLALQRENSTAAALASSQLLEPEPPTQDLALPAVEAGTSAASDATPLDRLDTLDLDLGLLPDTAPSAAPQPTAATGSDVVDLDILEGLNLEWNLPEPSAPLADTPLQPPTEVAPLELNLDALSLEEPSPMPSDAPNAPTGDKGGR